MGNKIKKTRGDDEIGKLIVEAWKTAAKNGTFAIDRVKLADDLVKLKYIDPSKNTGGNNKGIVFDLVFDTDLDSETRLVWIAIPTPDADTTEADWQKYIDGLSDTEITKIGESVLFGCGR